MKGIPFGSDCAHVHVHRLSAVSENTVQEHNNDTLNCCILSKGINVLYDTMK